MLSYLTKFRANLPESTMYSSTCIKSDSFSWCVLFSIPNKISQVGKLFKFAGRILDRLKRSGKNFRTPQWHVASGTMFFLYKWAFSELQDLTHACACVVICGGLLKFEGRHG